MSRKTKALQINRISGPVYHFILREDRKDTSKGKEALDKKYRSRKKDRDDMSEKTNTQQINRITEPF